MLMEESRVERKGRWGGGEGRRGKGCGWGEGGGAAESSIHVGAGGRREHAFLCSLPQALPRPGGDTLLKGETAAKHLTYDESNFTVHSVN